MSSDAYALSQHLLGDYPPTKGRAGGKLPIGKAALRSPDFNFSAACRKAALRVEARLPPAVRPGLAYRFANRRTKMELWS
jgi:hypothetical protein